MNTYNKTKVIFVTIFLFSCFNGILAQKSNLFNETKHRIGFNYGVGGQSILNVNYDYQIVFFQAQFYYVYRDNKTWGLDFLIQPEYNITDFREIDKVPIRTSGIETGINVGILIRKNLFNNSLSLYSFGSVGPHYISGAPERQSPNFIFSDNFFAGLNLKMVKNIYLDLRLGIRHLSNANLTRDNEGINNMMFNAGFIINLLPKHELNADKVD